jgi:preprotein translocase subunit YajC
VAGPFPHPWGRRIARLRRGARVDNRGGTAREVVLIAIAHAMAQQGGGGAGNGAGGFGAFIPLILMFAIFYFLLIRPQQKKTKEHREMIANLKKGDRIITAGGIHARITGLDDTTLTVELADKVRVKMQRSSVLGMLQSASPPRETKKAE